MQKIKVTYILSNIDKAIAFEWIAERFDNSKIELSFILLNTKEPFLYQWLKEKKIIYHYIPHFGKSSYPRTALKVFQILRTIKPTIIHTHLFDANLIGLTAAKLLGIKKRIYTRHHSTFHHDNFPKAVKYDKWANKLATHIIAISENVKEVLIEKENVPKEKISLIHHGFDLNQFQNVNQKEIEELKKKYKLNDSDSPIIGVVARYINLKGIQYIIPAFKRALTDYPNAKLILANASGPDQGFIKEQLQQLPRNSFMEIKFESNLFTLYQLFDIYVHTPIDKRIEAFGQTYVEALASGTPSIFTLSGVANEFIENNYNALVVDYKNSDDIYRAITTIIKDEKLKMHLIKNGLTSIKHFNLNTYISKLENIYSL